MAASSRRPCTAYQYASTHVSVMGGHLGSLRSGQRFIEALGIALESGRHDFEGRGLQALDRACGFEGVDPGQAFVIVAHLDQRSQRSAQSRRPITRRRVRARGSVGRPRRDARLASLWPVRAFRGRRRRPRRSSSPSRTASGRPPHLPFQRRAPACSSRRWRSVDRARGSARSAPLRRPRDPAASPSRTA